MNRRARRLLERVKRSNTLDFSEVREATQDRRLVLWRFVFALVFLSVVALVILGSFFWMQVVQYQKYLQNSESNRTAANYIPPVRGAIYDKNGTLLATNKAVSSIEVNMNLYDRRHLPDLYARLETLKSLLHLSASDQEALEKQLQKRTFSPRLLVLPNATASQRALFAVNRYRFPGFLIDERLQRVYPYGPLFAQSVGYVGPINVDESRTIASSSAYKAMFWIGKVGVERQYEELLRGSPGVRLMEVDAAGREVRSLHYNAPQNGQNLKLGLDAKLNELAYQLIGDLSGVVVAVNPKNGDILAYVNKPSADPNLFVNGLTQAEYTALMSDPKRPLFDRVRSGEYPPASTIKPILALNYLHKHILSAQETLYDPGYFKLDNDERLYHNWKREGHGLLDLRLAIKYSNDTYFFTMANRAGVSNVLDGYRAFRFGDRVTADIFGEHIVPLPGDAFKYRRFHQHWYPGDTLNLGIGQGFMRATPLNLAYMISALANPESPKLLHFIHSDLPTKLFDLPPLPYTPEELAVIRSGMVATLNESQGVAYGSFYNAPYKAAGKTGTAQVVSLPPNFKKSDLKNFAEFKRDHALFVGYAPSDNPQIAVAILTEHGIGGATSAAPIARKLFDYYLLKKLPPELSGGSAKKPSPVGKTEAPDQEDEE